MPENNAKFLTITDEKKCIRQSKKIFRAWGPKELKIEGSLA